MKKMNLQTLVILSFVFSATMAMAKDYIIYSIAQDFPMGTPNEVLKKNYYIDMGANQGLKKGNTVDVYRNISVLDPYESKKRYNHKVKIGELKIIHSEETSSIANLSKFESDEDAPMLEVGGLMIGDVVGIHVK